MKILTYKDYVAGWLDWSIHDFLEVLSPGDAGTKYALITCLDSNPNPASLRRSSQELKPIANRMREIGQGLVVPTKLLLETRVFFGFDEVWFFPSKDIQPKPPSVTLVGPARLSQAKVNQVGKWMTGASCTLGLGGGEGLNFVVRAHGPVRSLLMYLLEQPEPALAAV